MSSSETRAGHVAIIGLPNVGKSTLLNRLIGSKLSIVTPAAQTTRQRVVGIDTRPGVQLIFMDTPGLVDPAYLLHRSMLAAVEQAIGDADVVVILLDGTRGPPIIAPEIAASLSSLGNRLIVAINKVDISEQAHRLALRDWAVESWRNEPLAISAETGEGIEALRAAITGRMPISPFLFPEDEISSQATRFFVGEFIRETIFELFQDEVPYCAAIRVEEYRESDDPIYISATILVERDSQKGILIGRGGAAIRELGSSARHRIENFLESHVYLDLRVKVLPKWRKDPLELRRLGFQVPPDAATKNARS